MEPDKVRIWIQVGHTEHYSDDEDDYEFVSQGSRMVTLDTALNITKSMKDEVAYQTVKAFIHIMDELERR